MQPLLMFSLVLALVCFSYSETVDDKDTNKESKSAFGTPFDEIVVESHLTVRRKNSGRQARTQNATQEAAIIKTKREIKIPESQSQLNQIKKKHKVFSGKNFGNFGASASSAQAQGFNSFGPLGSFGASATSTQSQSFGVGPHGLAAAAGFSGTQQYNFNGQTIDVVFGNAFSGGKPGMVVTITGPDGKKRPLN